jgi:hypothetical protein
MRELSAWEITQAGTDTIGADGNVYVMSENAVLRIAQQASLFFTGALRQDPPACRASSR